MPDLDLIKQVEQEVRDRRGRFATGRSGNPAGRWHDCRDHVNGTARLSLAGEGEALTRKAVELALAAIAPRARKEQSRQSSPSPRLRGEGGCAPSASRLLSI